MKHLIKTAAICIIFIVVSNCRGFSVEKNTQVIKNNPFKIELRSNPTTGYDWHIDNLNPKYFKLVSSGFIKPDTNLCGAGGVRWWKIKPIKSGKQSISILYYRPWEGKTSAVDKYKLKVTIK